MAESSISQHFENKGPVVKSIYDRILQESCEFGTVIEEPKKTSIHRVNKSAFAGVATRKHALIAKSEQRSASRFHQEVN